MVAPVGLISALGWGNVRGAPPCAWEVASELETSHNLEAGRGVNLSDPFRWDDTGTAAAAAGAVITVIFERPGQGANQHAIHILVFIYIVYGVEASSIGI